MEIVEMKQSQHAPSTDELYVELSEKISATKNAFLLACEDLAAGGQCPYTAAIFTGTKCSTCDPGNTDQNKQSTYAKCWQKYYVLRALQTSK